MSKSRLMSKFECVGEVVEGQGFEPCYHLLGKGHEEYFWTNLL